MHDTDPGFIANCLHQWVLEVAYLQFNTITNKAEIIHNPSMIEKYTIINYLFFTAVH